MAKHLQNLKNLILNKTSQFTKNESGNFTVITATLLPVLMLGSFASLEYSNMSRSKSKMQQSADIAVLAATKHAETLDGDLTQEEKEAKLKAYFKKFYSANYSADKSDTNFEVSDENVKFTIDPATGKVDVKVDLSYGTAALGLFNVESVPISVSASAQMKIVEENYIIDIVMCLDATGSMQLTLDSVKKQALTFNKDLKAALGGKEENIKIRVKPIFYRDWDDEYYYNSKNKPYWWDYYYGRHGDYYEGGLIEGDFIDLDPSDASGLTTEKQEEKLSNFIGSERAAGGFDLPEAAGACLNEGLRSKWFDNQAQEARDYFDIPATTEIINSGDTPSGDGLYTHVTTIPVVVFWTDASISSLQKSRDYLSSSTPKTYSKFKKLWNKSKIIDQERKLLIHFGPGSGSGWNNIKTWDRYTYGGSLLLGNSAGVKVIAEKIKDGIPDFLRITS